MHPWWEARAIALAAHHRLLHDVSKAGRGDRAGVPGRPGGGAAARAHRAPTGGDARGLCRTSTLASDRSESRRHQKARSRVHGVRDLGPSAVAQSGARAGLFCRPRRAVGRGPVEIYRRLGSRPSTGRSRTPWRGLLTCGTGPSPRSRAPWRRRLRGGGPTPLRRRLVRMRAFAAADMTAAGLSITVSFNARAAAVPGGRARWPGGREV